jgi:hypothetical protein
MYKFIYEYAGADTYQPPMQEDLRNQKIFLQYAYRFNKDFTAHINYINILNDNIAITSKGKAYGLGISYNFNKNLSAGFTQYYTDYKDFNVAQSDFDLEYKNNFNGIKYKISSLNKYIVLDEKYQNSFTKNAQDSYFTTAIKLHTHYNSYHLGLGAYFAKRAFAIMNNGFKIQHHAMEFNRTYALGFGKTFSNIVLRAQYIYMRATELPIENQDVEINTIRLLANYKF